MYIQHHEQTHQVPVTVKLRTAKLRNRRLITNSAPNQSAHYERDEPDVM